MGSVHLEKKETEIGFERKTKLWSSFQNSHSEALDRHGYENFRRVIGWNYFTHSPNILSAQFRFLFRKIPMAKIARFYIKAHTSKEQYLISKERVRQYTFLALCECEYMDRTYGSIWRSVKPSMVGNPPEVESGGKFIDLDLMNSFLEYEKIKLVNKLKSVVEIGGGYGRTAYVLLKKFPHLKYTFIDVEPALSIARYYISKNFGAEVRSGQIRFIRPSQISSIPENSVDLLINISSFHEMHFDTVQEYLKQAERIAAYVYIKEYKKSVDSDIQMSEKDYHRKWKTIYSGTCEVNTQFFEALYKTK